MAIRNDVITETFAPFQSYIISNMSEVYVDPPPFNLQASFDDSDPKTPLIFLLSPGSDPMINLYAFAAEHDMTDKYVFVVESS